MTPRSNLLKEFEIIIEMTGKKLPNTPNMSLAEFILHAPTCLWRWNRVFRNVGI